jgi:hypothetical protein
MNTINESTFMRCIGSCLETAEHYIGRSNRRDAEYWLDCADAYADRLITYRKIGDMIHAAYEAGREQSPTACSASERFHSLCTWTAAP